MMKNSFFTICISFVNLHILLFIFQQQQNWSLDESISESVRFGDYVFFTCAHKSRKCTVSMDNNLFSWCKRTMRRVAVQTLIKWSCATKQGLCKKRKRRTPRLYASMLVLVPQVCERFQRPTTTYKLQGTSLWTFLDVKIAVKKGTRGRKSRACYVNFT